MRKGFIYIAIHVLIWTNVLIHGKDMEPIHTWEMSQYHVQRACFCYLEPGLGSCDSGALYLFFFRTKDACETKDWGSGRLCYWLAVGAQR